MTIISGQGIIKKTAGPGDRNPRNRYLQENFMNEFSVKTKICFGDALADGCTATNPRKVTKEEIRQIYEKAYYGKLP